ncbi:protein canopy homolog 2-like isoform X2 [Tubulanus polymorphus]
MFVFMLVLLVTFSSAAKLSKDEICGACLALVDEVNNEIKQVDPKKMIKVGSFRVDGQGNQPHVRQVPYATSEEKLHEVVEQLCGKLHNYTKHTPEGSSESLCVRSTSRDYTSYRTLGITTDRDLGLRLKRACQDIVDDHEEEIITMFNKNEEDIDLKLCKDLAGVCSTETVQQKREFLSKEPQMVEQAKLEEEKERVKEEAERKIREAEEEKKKAEEEAAKKEAKKENDDDEKQSENEDDKSTDDDNNETDANKDEL